MLETALVHIKAREDEFSKLDAVIGDGDHGQAIVAAMAAIVASSRKGTEFKSMLNGMGFDVMLQVSGSTSTLLGAFFLGMSDAVEGTALSAAEVKAMFAAGLANVRKQTKARKGDKTMMDALVPAVEAMESCASSDVAEVFKTGAEAAVKARKPLLECRRTLGVPVITVNALSAIWIAERLHGVVCLPLLQRLLIIKQRY